MPIHDAEDKAWWIEWGVEKEKDFLKLCEKRQILPGIAKSKGTVYMPEFTYAGRYLDLKTVGTPFFVAQRRYNVDSNFAVTLNRTDVMDCQLKYPECQIVFWVNWEAANNFGIDIQKQSGIWFLSYERMCQLIAKAPEHRYSMRDKDNKQGNATSSFVLDLREMEQLEGGKDE